MSGGMNVTELKEAMVDLVDIAEETLNDMGVENTETNMMHMTMLLVIMGLYVQKNEIHQDTWKQYGWRDSLMHMRSKLTRVEHQFSNGDVGADLDDAMDLVNYTLFFIRNVCEGNRNGTDRTVDEQAAAEIITQIAMRKGDPAFVAAIHEALR